MKKGQITIFIVLGIVIMIIFGLVFFIRNVTSSMILEKKINKIYDDFLSSTNIKYIIDGCLDRTTKEALLLVGLQGGRIYDYQIDNGYHIKSFYEVIPFNYTGRNPNGVIYNVSYGIKAPTSNIPYPNPPNYPYLRSLVSDVSKSTISAFFTAPNSAIFANIPDRRKFTILADLCNKLGPNDPSIFGFDIGSVISCETYSTRNESIQEYLKEYILQNIADCINLTLKKTSKYNISTGALSSTVLIGGNDLLVSLIYPIEISIENKPPITKYLDFNIRPNIRLKILHEIASHLIGYDPNWKPTNPSKVESNNIFFDITKEDPNNCKNITTTKYSGHCITEGINVFKISDYCIYYNCNFDNRHYNYSDILVIEDDMSIIDGNSYRFQFAIENRRPALDFIDESVSSDKYYYWYINTTYGKNLTQLYNALGFPISNAYNIVTTTNSILKIFPLGIDPDEDNLIYDYVVPGGRLLSSFPKEVWINTGLSSFTVLINASDNEGLYDYQEIEIKVV